MIENIDEILKETNAYNKEVHKWSLTVKQALKKSVLSIGINDTKALFSSIKTKNRKKFGEIANIGIGLERYGIFVEKGVGSGRGIGSESAKRNRNPWFNPTLEKHFDLLNEIIADHVAEVNYNKIKIL